MGKGYEGALGTTHAKAKELAKKYRRQGYSAFIERSGSKWYVYRTEEKKAAKGKQYNVYKGEYFAIGDNKDQAERTVDRVSNQNSKVLMLPPKKSSVQSLRRKVPRITPKMPRLR